MHAGISVFPVSWSFHPNMTNTGWKSNITVQWQERQDSNNIIISTTNQATTKWVICLTARLTKSCMYVPSFSALSENKITKRPTEFIPHDPNGHHKCFELCLKGNETKFQKCSMRQYVTFQQNVTTVGCGVGARVGCRTNTKLWKVIIKKRKKWNLWFFNVQTLK